MRLQKNLQIEGGRDLKIISLNMNKGRPCFQRQIAFIKGQDAGLVFLQEVLEHQVSILSSNLGMHAYWGRKSQTNHLDEGFKGNLILSAKPLTNAFVYDLGSFDQGRKGPRYENLNISLVGGHCEGLGVVACIHLPWSFSWQVDDVQRRALKTLLGKIGELNIGLLGLDVNSARVLPNGTLGEIWAGLASVLSDGVPLDILSTIDPKLHRLGREENVIDGLFFNPRVVRVTSLTKNTSLSDHCALVSFVEVL